MIPLATSLHLLSAVIWVGGMFFAYLILRPVAALQFEPPERLTLWANIFSKFFPWVWAAIFLLVGTGLWLIQHKFGGMKFVTIHIHIMLSLGMIMALIFVYLFFKPNRQLQRAVSQQNWPEAGQALAQIRTLIGANLHLGLITIVVASAGRYFFL